MAAKLKKHPSCQSRSSSFQHGQESSYLQLPNQSNSLQLLLILTYFSFILWKLLSLRKRQVVILLLLYNLRKLLLKTRNFQKVQCQLEMYSFSIINVQKLKYMQSHFSIHILVKIWMHAFWNRHILLELGPSYFLLYKFQILTNI